MDYMNLWKSTDWLWKPETFEIVCHILCICVFFREKLGLPNFFKKKKKSPWPLKIKEFRWVKRICKFVIWSIWGKWDLTLVRCCCSVIDVFWIHFFLKCDSFHVRISLFYSSLVIFVPVRTWSLPLKSSLHIYYFIFTFLNDWDVLFKSVIFAAVIACFTWNVLIF